jgi:chemotaxis signal transduction protein
MSEPASVDQWIVCRVDKLPIAVPATHVREMMRLPRARPIPQAPAELRGLMQLRGVVLPVIDLRQRFGLPSWQAGIDALCAMLRQREQDHRNWLAELDSSVSEGREFKLTTDPHACAFGKWYDNYRPDDPWLAAALRKFDAPHRRIHAVGVDAISLMRKNQTTAAQEVIRGTRDTDLQTMIGLFVDLQARIRETFVETAVVVEANGRSCAIAVDAIESVETLKPGAAPEMPSLVSSIEKLVSGIGHRASDGSLIMLMDVERLIFGAGELAATN